MKPEFVALGDVYRFDWPDLNISIELDRLAEERGQGLSCEIVVQSERPPRPGLLTRQRFNLSAGQTRKTLAKMLEDRAPELDWAGMLEQVCFLALDRWRTGDPLVDLRQVSLADRPRWLLQPYVEMGGPTDLFADGGTGKSVMALAIAASVASGQAVVGTHRPFQSGAVLYLDWETDRYVHRERLAAIVKGAGLSFDDMAPIYYRQEVASLPEAAAYLRRQIVEREVVMVIVDSLGPARGDDPESAGATIRVFNAARSLAVPTLFVDHVTKAEGTKKKPFGSVYAYNLSRLVWGMVKAQSEGEAVVNMALSCHKSNNGLLLPRHGYSIDFQGEGEALESICFRECDPTMLPGFGEFLSRKDQIAGVLKANHGAPMTPDDIALALEVDGIELGANAVRAALNRYSGHPFVKAGRGWSLIFSS